MVGVEEQHRKLWRRQCRESLLARFELYASNLEPIERFGNKNKWDLSRVQIRTYIDIWITSKMLAQKKKVDFWNNCDSTWDKSRVTWDWKLPKFNTENKNLKTYSKRIWKSCSQCFVMKNYWYELWFSYTFYLHMGLLIFSKNFGKILLMSWINQAFILGHNTWVRRITIKTSLISTVFTKQVEKNNQEIISKRCICI